VCQKTFKVTNNQWI